MSKPMFSEDDEQRPLLTKEEPRDACLHAAATIVVATMFGCEFEDCSLNDDGLKWPTPVSRIELKYPPAMPIDAVAAIHEVGSMAVAKRHGRGHHLIRLVGGEQSGTLKLLDDPKVWKAIETLAQFIRDNYQRESCFMKEPGEDCAMLRLIKSMDLPSLTQQRKKDRR